MAFNIEEIRANLALGGARPTLFNVTLTAPAGGIGLSSVAVVKIPFLCSAASLPESSLGTVQVPYFGRKIKLAGDRTFAPWVVTILNDEDFIVRNFFETWTNMINSLQGNLLQFASASPPLYQGLASATQFSKTGIPVRIYQFNDLWPSLVSPITLDWNATDQIETFQVTFEYDYWNIQGGITGNSGGL